MFPPGFGKRGAGVNMRRLWILASLPAMAAVTIVMLTSAGGATASRPRAHTAAAPRVLLVGSYKGIPGQYSAIQDAVDAANPGDWILVGPGDYHEQADHRA